MKEFIDKLISRLEELQKQNYAISEVVYGINEKVMYSSASTAYANAIEEINELAEEYNNGWIPFTDRELTEEEKEYYGEDVKHMLDCKLPEEDEEILVTSKYKDKLYVDTDTFMRDGSECYLDSGRDLVTEVIAWQSLPAPYKKGVEYDRE